MTISLSPVGGGPGKTLESLNVTDPQGDAQEVPIMNDTASEQGSENEDSASDTDGDLSGCAAAESEDGIVDEAVPPSPI